MAGQNPDHDYPQPPEGMETESLGRKRPRETDGDLSEVLSEDSATEIKRKPNPDEVKAGDQTDIEPKDPKNQGLSLGDLMGAIQGIGSELAELKQDFKNSQGSLSREVNDLAEKVSKSEGATASVSEAVKENTESIEQIRRELDRLKESGSLSTLSPFGRNEARTMRLQIESLEGYSRRFNLIIVGLAEVDNETDEALSGKVYSFMANMLGISSITFDICHRLGPKLRGTDRRVIVKFTYLRDKKIVWEARSMLKSSRLYKLFQDKPKSVKEREALSFKILRAAQVTGQYRVCKFQGGKLWFDGIPYEMEDYDSLPEVLRPAYVCSPRNNSRIAFFSKFSPLSNHYPSTFAVRGVVYVCMEQYLARSRAIFSKNQLLAERVLRLNDPADHKRILDSMKEDGRTPAWQLAINSWLLPGLEAKFAQNATAREFLLETKDLQIGEATTNLFWGIGMELRDPNLFNPAYWTGQNTMGEALVQIRQSLKDHF